MTLNELNELMYTSGLRSVFHSSLKQQGGTGKPMIHMRTKQQRAQRSAPVILV